MWAKSHHIILASCLFWWCAPAQKKIALILSAFRWKKWVSFHQLFVQLADSYQYCYAGALSEWPSGSWSPPWLRLFYPYQSERTGGPALGKVLVVPNFFHLLMMETTMLNGIFSAAAIFLFCGLQSGCRNFWRMISGNRIHLSSLLRVMANAVNTYATVLFLFFLIFNRFAKV